MATINVAADSCPLNGALTLEGVERDSMDDSAWILTQKQAAQILDAWQAAPKELDVIREWAHFENGYFITALTMDGETNIDNWESDMLATHYSTSNMPLDLAITELSSMELISDKKPKHH